MKRVVLVWAPSLIDGHSFIHRHGLEEFFVQFLRDEGPPRGYWVVLNIQSNVWHAVKSVPATPRLAVIE